MIAPTKILYFILFILFVSIFCSIPKLFAISPEFSSEEIINMPKKEWNILKPQTNCPLIKDNASKIKDYSVIPQISSANYYSNGKTLNVNMMLSRPFNGGPDPHNYDYVYHYMLMIDLPSNYESKNNVGSITYTEQLLSNNSPKNWNITLSEISSNGDIITFINKAINTENIFNAKRNIINFSLDLSPVGFPQNYILHLEAEVDIVNKDNKKICSLIDTTNGFLVPIPKYFISAIPSSIDLRPGENKTIQVKISTNVPVRNSNIELFSHYDHSLLQMQFYPSHISIPPLGSNISIVNIRALDNISKQRLPISQTPITNAISNVFPVIYHGNYIVEGNSLNTNISNSFSNLTITILPHLSPGENFVSFWNNFGGFISFIGGGFAAGFSALVFQRFFKKNGLDKN
jgi:hypothetical protein